MSRVWPVGFGWSSYVARNFMVSYCDGTGFARGQLVAEEGRIGPAQDAMVSIATDDVLHFLRASPDERAAIT